MCVSSGGDGRCLADEECHDSNARSGNGCSSTCKIEAGFTCEDETAAPPDTLRRPVQPRDLGGANRAIPPQTPHHDVTSFGPCPTLNMVMSTLGSDAGMVHQCSGRRLQAEPRRELLVLGWTGTSDDFDHWYRPVDGVNVTVPYGSTRGDGVVVANELCDDGQKYRLVRMALAAGSLTNTAAIPVGRGRLSTRAG